MDYYHRMLNGRSSFNDELDFVEDDYDLDLLQGPTSYSAYSDHYDFDDELMD